MKFSHEEFKMELRDSLMQIRPRRVVNDTQIAIRCPICGDSRKDKRKTRFYIYLEDDPVMYYCFNCNESGVLSTSILRSIEINDLDVLSALQSYNKRSTRNNTNYKFKSEKIDVVVPFPDTELESNIKKKEYIESRLGIPFTFEELVRLKTVFRLGDFLLENKINELTVKGDKALNIHENYVGFLTTNNETINARKVFKSNYERYEKYSLFKNRVNTLKFYNIPTVVDTLDTGRITIDIAEGVFDIWSIYYNIHNGGLDNHIYTAVCGSGYKTVIEYFIKEGIIGDVDINIYADNDQYLNDYKDLKKEYGIWFNSFNLYSNGIGNDFGVPRDKIDLVKNKL